MPLPGFPSLFEDPSHERLIEGLDAAQLLLEAEPVAAEGGAPEVEAVATGTWGGWTANANATVRVPATTAGTWGGWTATAAATKRVSAAATGVWGGWTATGDADVQVPASGVGTWGGWTATASATVQVPATANGAWGGWTATTEIDVEVPATAEGTWGGWVATASATVVGPTLPPEDPRPQPMPRSVGGLRHVVVVDDTAVITVKIVMDGKVRRINRADDDFLMLM